MISLKSSFIIALFTCVAACGRQVVDFPFGDDGGQADGNIDGPIVDAPAPDALSDAPLDAPLGIRPTVTSTTPLTGATGVSTNVRPTATFSKAMDPASLDPLTFTLAQGATPIGGTVTLDSFTNTATFAPTSPLVAGLDYTASIATGAMDTAGVPLATSVTWTFTTGACAQAPITLGVAGTFAVLAGSTVTSTGLTTVTGDLGVSPLTAVTGFPPGILVGTQHTDATSATAIADLTTAYNEAAGRGPVECVTAVAGNLGGMTLVPGLYKSTSSLIINSGNLTLDAQGDPDAVWVITMATTLETTSGLGVILAGGARSEKSTGRSGRRRPSARARCSTARSWRTRRSR